MSDPDPDPDLERAVLTVMYGAESGRLDVLNVTHRVVSREHDVVNGEHDVVGGGHGVTDGGHGVDRHRHNVALSVNLTLLPRWHLMP